MNTNKLLLKYWNKKIPIDTCDIAQKIGYKLLLKEDLECGVVINKNPLHIFYQNSDDLYWKIAHSIAKASMLKESHICVNLDNLYATSGLNGNANRIAFNMMAPPQVIKYLQEKFALESNVELSQHLKIPLCFFD